MSAAVQATVTIPATSGGSVVRRVPNTDWWRRWLWPAQARPADTISTDKQQTAVRRRRRRKKVDRRSGHAMGHARWRYRARVISSRPRRRPQQRTHGIQQQQQQQQLIPNTVVCVSA
uniref:Uncharacterized protein n=1 Tax=Anopheles maculatus TaxID=74869 RepID=A0A182SZN0_9DIPT